MDRMNDILARSATQRARNAARSMSSADDARRDAPHPPARGPRGPQAPGAPAGQHAPRLGPRGAIPPSRRPPTRAGGDTRPAAGKPVPPADPRMPEGTRRAPDTADALDADRILELPPRRVSATPAQHAAAPQRPRSPGGMVSLREAAGDYIAGLRPRRRPESERASATPGQPHGTSGTSGVNADDAPSALEDSALCPRCHGAGYLRLEVPLGDPSFGQAVPCTCKERQREERRLSDLRRYSSLEAFHDKTFETMDCAVPGVREACEVAHHFAEDPQGWLVLRGGYGTGKTHLAAAIANYQLSAGRPVFFSIVPDLLDHLRAAFAPTSETTYDVLFDKIREAGLLVLDDLGAENNTAWATEKLFQLINYRYNFRMPTVITTNHKLLSHMDERIRSRLSDLGLVRAVVIEAADYRERHAGRASRRESGGAGGTGGSAPRKRDYAR